MSEKRYTDALEQLCKVLNLSEDAIAVAEGWSVLPESIQRHFKLLLDDYVASLHPALGQLYSNVRHADQLRFNRIVERIQAKRRASDGPSKT